MIRLSGMMRAGRRSAGLALLAALALGACGQASGFGDWREGVANQVGGPMPGVGDDEAEIQRLDAAGAPYMSYSLPAYGVSTNLIEMGTRDGVSVWRSLDNIQVHTREGIIIATRGLGFDLIAADPGEAATLIRSGQNGSTERSWRHLDGQGQLVNRRWYCEIEPAGIEAIRQGSSQARRVEETCYGQYGEFTNTYWVAGGTIVRSAQYVGADLGVIELQTVPRTRAPVEEIVVEVALDFD